MEKQKEYSNGELTVVWKPNLCIHSANCVHGSPDVFKPKDKPWIHPENSSTEKIKATIDNCPSGALSYYMNAVGKPATTSEVSEEKIKIEVINKGPLMVYGTLHVKHFDGSEETKKRVTAFCRCGHSDNKPFCDGSHNTAL
ncbi:(4Fe-4S)-binding protein [Ulvibacter antarcticus]|uniref:Putative Fe-S cluster protein YjdI n=1 Tax=Ulvibacter antarcticus TaxID=442714 RepID=A0A3L9YAP5_9FLAO|nr:(4Fe-4S)-binding protein [Ulvibacter antarcticus]RMA57803.1 putative Fe-S cluster protein YjdI [Ulvibacter antarcticus]